MKRTFVFVFIVFLLTFTRVSNALVHIDSVIINPPSPGPLETISVVTDGWSGTNFIGVDYTDFLQIDHSLELDIYCSVGLLTIVDSFHHTELLETFSPGDYDLTVRTFSSLGGNPYEYGDTFVTSFTVIPEPTTFLLLGFGAVMLRRKTQLPHNS